MTKSHENVHYFDINCCFTSSSHTYIYNKRPVYYTQIRKAYHFKAYNNMYENNIQH